MKNSEYWEERIAQETWKQYNDLEERNIELLNMYEKTSRNIKSELLAIAEKAETEGGLTRTDQYRMQKLLGQQGVIYKECERLGEQIETRVTKDLISGGNQVYKNVLVSLGESEFHRPDKKTMEQMLRNPWKGSFFSERLWKDMGKLERNLNGVVSLGISTGKTVTEMAVQLSNVMNRSFNDTHRLVRTETINYLNRSAKMGYEKAGIKKVQWWAASDERTCDICGVNHGKEYLIDKAPNLPCHPGCRCTWLPVIDDETDNELTRDETAALVKYISPDSYVLNEKLRNGYDLSECDKLWICQLDTALDKMPKIEGVVHRSLGFMFIEDEISFVQHHVAGKTINYKQYISSSTSSVYNEVETVQLVILSKTGRNIRKINPRENEVLFKRDVEFDIIEIKKENDKTFIYLKERS